MRYLLLLRGVNVGGNHKVNMACLQAQLCAADYTNVQTYINSGNVVFDAPENQKAVNEAIKALLTAHYSFEIPFAVIPGDAYLREAKQLPDWWYTDMARKDVLFYLDPADRDEAQARIGAMQLKDERVHFGSLAIFWGKRSMQTYTRTAYARQLIKLPLYKRVTIRNANTFAALGQMLLTTPSDDTSCP